MSYTVIVAAFNDEPSPVLEEYPVRRAVAGRALHALGQRRAGRAGRFEAACRRRRRSAAAGENPGPRRLSAGYFLHPFADARKGASIKTALRLRSCRSETKGGDITDYISTNIISITDGQIVLSRKTLTAARSRRSITDGIPVGRRLQTSSMKKTRFQNPQRVAELSGTARGVRAGEHG